MKREKKIKFRPALLWEKERKGIRCLACARKCLIKENSLGFCLVRLNLKNKLYTLNFGKIISLDVDPVEKLHLFHFLPGSKTLSITILGDNISPSEDIFQEEFKVKGKEYTPERVAEIAKKKKCKSVTFVGVEPATYFEFAFRTAKFARRLGLKSIFVTNGLVSVEAIKKLAKYIDVFLVNIKASLSPSYYTNFEGINVKPIFRALKQIGKSRAHLEIVNKVIPQVGDDIEQARKLASWISSKLDSSIPLHFVRFFPDEKFPELPATPLETLEKCIDVARRAGLRYVYIGDVPGHLDEDTYCFNCRELLIDREFYRIKSNFLVNGRCPKCGIKIEIIEE